MKPKVKVRRWSVMCIPGDADDGSDSWWYVVDQRKPPGKSGFVTEEIGSGDAARDRAWQVARDRNKR